MSGGVSDRRAMTYMLGVVSRARSASTGVAALFAFGERVLPRDPIWATLRRIDFAADALRIEQRLAKLLATKPPRARQRGFYFGLNTGSSIQLGYSPFWQPDADEGEDEYGDEAPWSERCDRFPGDLDSEAIDEVYREIEHGHLAEGLFVFGYTGLALRRAASRLEPALLVGEAPSRALCWGWRSAESYMLGTVDKKRFTPVRRAEVPLPKGAWRVPKKPARDVEPPEDLSTPPRRAPARKIAACRAKLEWVTKPIEYSPDELADGRAIGPLTYASEQFYRLGDGERLDIVRQRVAELLGKMKRRAPPVVTIEVLARAAMIVGRAGDTDGARMYIDRAEQRAAVLLDRRERDWVAGWLADTRASVSTLPEPHR
jgi:hypothetical protein